MIQWLSEIFARFAESSIHEREFIALRNECARLREEVRRWQDAYREIQEARVLDMKEFAKRDSGGAEWDGVSDGDNPVDTATKRVEGKREPDSDPEEVYVATRADDWVRRYAPPPIDEPRPVSVPSGDTPPYAPPSWRNPITSTAGSGPLLSE